MITLELTQAELNLIMESVLYRLVALKHHPEGEQDHPEIEAQQAMWSKLVEIDMS